MKKAVTLIEVLVSVILLAISIAPLLMMINTYYKMSVNRAKTQAAAIIVETEMERIRKDNSPGGRIGIHKENITSTKQIKDYIAGNNGTFNLNNSIPGKAWVVDNFSLDSTLKGEKFYIDYDTMNVFINNSNMTSGDETTDASILQVKVRVRWNNGADNFVMTTYTR